MPARFVYWMNVSLDLMIDLEANEQGGGDWMRIGESLHLEFNKRARTLSQAVEGRIIYETMEEYWPQAMDDESQPAFMREYGEIWTNSRKILVSNTRTSADHNTTIFGGDNVIDQLAQLRAESEGDIGVGGANLATQLLQANLLDEIMLFTHPVILGRGRPLFDELNEPLQLDLLEQQTYENGVTLHRYSVRGAR